MSSLITFNRFLGENHHRPSDRCNPVRNIYIHFFQHKSWPQSVSRCNSIVFIIISYTQCHRGLRMKSINYLKCQHFVHCACNIIYCNEMCSNCSSSSETPRRCLLKRLTPTKIVLITAGLYSTSVITLFCIWNILLFFFNELILHLRGII